MPYYHVYISNSVELEELDLSKKALVEHVVKPFLSGEKFLCRGKFVDPFEIKRIRIFRTEKPSSQFSESTVRLLYSLNLSALTELSDIASDVTRDFITRAPTKGKNIFIVHGRVTKPVRELKAMLQRFGLNPIVIHEQPSGSRTIVEKLEKYSDVGYAFVILTPDDIGVSFQDLFEKTAKCSYEDEALNAARRILEQSKGNIERFIEFNQKFMQEPEDASKFLEFLIPRARQNVVLEFGYFMGLLGRDRVCCLYKGDVELPSDLHGIVYIPFKETINEVRNKIIKELKAAGYEIRD